MTAETDRAPAFDSFNGRLARVRELLARPLFSYHLLLGVSALLMALGLMMVLSASSIEALQTRQSAFALFGRQFIAATLGLLLMWICSRLPIRFFRLAGYPLMVFAALGLVLVLFIGDAEQGAQRWIYIGELTVQPSEPAKLALVVWGADLLARWARAGQIEWRRLLIPLLPGLAIMAVLVMLGSDLGTTLVLMMIFLALLWVVGAPLKLFGGMLAVILLAVITMISSEGYRSNRIAGWLNPQGTAQGAGYQLVQGQMGIGSGGWFGVGLGAASRSGTGPRTPRATSSSPSSARSSV